MAWWGSNLYGHKKVNKKWFVIDRCCSVIFSLTGQKFESARRKGRRTESLLQGFGLISLLAGLVTG